MQDFSLSQSKRMPKAFGFATLGYGNPPGQDFFKITLIPYYIVGEESNGISSTGTK